MNLNECAWTIAESVASRPEDLGVVVHDCPSGARLIDFGVDARGGLEAGVELARICTSGLADVAIVPGRIAGKALPLIQVWTDHPVAACLASQYAGWQLQHEKFFAMGSGPMRAAYGKEPIFEKIGRRESPQCVVGVLETRKQPPIEVVEKIASGCGVAPANVTLAYAPTASLAGGLQIVARSVETALHKLAELGFDLDRIVSGHGLAPLPPVAKNDLAAIGRTNDSILYAASVTLFVRGDDGSIEELGPRVPSSSSRDFGEPFAELFSRFNHDFYAIDPLLFSPAEIVFQNLETGRVHSFGKISEGVIEHSFFNSNEK